MSRTLKDRPLWVRSNDPNEQRVAYHYHRRSYQSGMNLSACTDGCTLETSVNRRRSEWRLDDSPCGYVVEVSHNYHNTPDRATRRSAFHRPNRMAVKTYARQAMDAYNHDEEWDDEGVPERTNPNIKTYWRW